MGAGKVIHLLTSIRHAYGMSSGSSRQFEALSACWFDVSIDHNIAADIMRSGMYVMILLNVQGCDAPHLHSFQDVLYAYSCVGLYSCFFRLCCCASSGAAAAVRHVPYKRIMLVVLGCDGSFKMQHVLGAIGLSTGVQR